MNTRATRVKGVSNHLVHRLSVRRSQRWRLGRVRHRLRGWLSRRGCLPPRILVRCLARRRICLTGGILKIKPELDRRLLFSIGDQGLHELWICVDVKLHETQVLLVGLHTNLLYFVGFRILDQDYISIAIFQPA